MTNKEKEFRLSINNIKDINYDKYEQNFTFIVNNERFSTTRIVADLLSPKIRQLHFIDDTIQEFYIETKNNESKYFKDFLKLSTFHTIEIDEERRERYIQYFLQLGNIDEYFKLQGPNTETHTIQEAIEYLQNQEKLFSNKTETIYLLKSNNEQIITFICQHFYEISIEDLFKLSQETILEIIRQPTLVIKDEDWLLDLVIEMYSKDSRYSNLFSSILFFNLKYESLEKFINTFSKEDMTSEIWESICDCLLKLKQPNSKSLEKDIKTRYHKKFKEFKIEQGNEFKGIMHYLTNKTGGNIHDNGTIEITSNSIAHSDYQPKNCVDYKNDNIYASNNSTLAYVCFDFKDNRIQLSNYSIESYDNGKNYENLRSWVVEVSNDGEKYLEIDCHSDDETLNGSNNIGIFNISKGNDQFYRFIRLRQTNYSWWGYPNCNNHQIYIQFIEFFGKFEEKNE